MYSYIHFYPQSQSLPPPSSITFFCTTFISTWAICGSLKIQCSGNNFQCKEISMQTICFLHVWLVKKGWKSTALLLQGQSSTLSCIFLANRTLPQHLHKIKHVHNLHFFLIVILLWHVKEEVISQYAIYAFLPSV